MAQETHQSLSFGNPKFKDGDSHVVTALAFPDKVWEWEDARSTVFGGSVICENLEAGVPYLAYPGNDIRKSSVQRTEVGGGKELLERSQLVYLNETRWLKPKPVRVLLDKNNPHNVEAIETDVDGERVDFWIDRENHLPVKIIRYRDFKYGKGLEPSSTYDLADYQQTDGIQIPNQVSTTIISPPASTVRYRTTLNPKLRADLFTSPPRFEDGPEAWKSK